MFIAGVDGGSVISVLKSKLTEALEKNRAQHHNEYLEAHARHRKAVELALVRKLRQVRHDEKFNLLELHTDLPSPEDHTDDYDRVIKMLEMCTKDEVLVSEQEFKQYVMDDWAWAGHTKMTNAVYGVGVAVMKKGKRR